MFMHKHTGVTTMLHSSAASNRDGLPMSSLRPIEACVDTAYERQQARERPGPQAYRAESGPEKGGGGGGNVIPRSIEEGSRFCPTRAQGKPSYILPHGRRRREPMFAAASPGLSM